jgi:hypothetical protein
MYRLNHKMARRLAAWVGITAVVFNALWPLMVQLKPNMAAMHMAAMQMEDCGDSSMHQPGAAGDNSAPDQSSPLMPHCAFCTLVAGGFTALVAAGVVPVASIDTEESRYALPMARAIAYFSYSSAQPRAPPVLS